MSRLRDHLLARLHPGRAIVVPDSIVLVPSSAAAAGPAAEGGPPDGAVRALLAAVAAVHGFEPDPGESYVTAGCSLAKVPAVLRRLAAEGFGGPVTEDFVRPLSLSRLAAALVPVAR